MSSIGRTPAYQLHLFGQKCTSQIAMEIGRTPYALHCAVSHSSPKEMQESWEFLFGKSVLVLGLGWSHWSHDMERDFFILHLTSYTEAGAQYVFMVNYTAPLTDSLTGFYRSSYSYHNQTRLVVVWMHTSVANHAHNICAHNIYAKTCLILESWIPSKSMGKFIFQKVMAHGSGRYFFIILRDKTTSVCVRRNTHLIPIFSWPP